MKLNKVNSTVLFLLTPLREGRQGGLHVKGAIQQISTHAPAGGATGIRRRGRARKKDFYSRPCGRGDSIRSAARRSTPYFYSRPCGRGDTEIPAAFASWDCISTHAPAGGATAFTNTSSRSRPISTHAPAGGATSCASGSSNPHKHFYSRPCGRGDRDASDVILQAEQFLLTPLREGRPEKTKGEQSNMVISTHAPAGGATRKPCTSLQA